MTNRMTIRKGIYASSIFSVLLFAASSSFAQAAEIEKKAAATKETKPAAKETKPATETPVKDTGKDEPKKDEDTKPAEPAPGAAETPASATTETPPAETGSAAPTGEPAASSDEEPAKHPRSIEMTGTTTAAPASDKTVTETSSAAPPMPPPKEERRLRHLVTVSYEMAVGVGDTWDFVGRFSPRGISIDYLYYLTPQIGLGVMMGWNDFEIKERGTFTDQRVTLTGTQIRRLDTWLLNASFNYGFLPIDRFASPHLGLNMGVYRTRRGIDYGWWGVMDEGWHFGFAPDLGVNLNFKKFLIQLGCRFHWAIQTSSSDGERWVTFNIGFSVPGY